MLRLHPLPTVIPFFFTSLGGACYKTVKVLVAQLCLTLCDPMDYSPLGPSVYGIL